MKKTHQKFRRFAAILVGIVLIASGLLKIIDPVGTMLKVQEYMKFLHLAFLLPSAKVFGIVLALFESLLGIALITGVLRKLAAWCTYILLGIFTIITLVLWIKNPQMDCGCFGDAIHMSHAQSFWKNVILLALTVFAFTPFHDFGEPKPNRIVAACIAALSVLYAVWYSNTHLPIIDFTPFHLGTELYASLDDNLAADNHYKAAYVYEKDGKEGVFDLSGLPDSTWTFVRVDTVFRKTTTVSEEYPILSFSDAEGEYHDHDAVEGRTVLISVYDPSDVSWDKVREQYNMTVEAGGTPLVLVSATPSDPSLPTDLPLYFADYKTLVTLNRSNGGGSYFFEGEMISQWDVNHLHKDLKADFAQDPVDLSTSLIIKRRLRTQGFCVYLAALLLLV